MKWCRFSVGGEACYGLIEGESVRRVDGIPWERHAVTEERHRLAAVKLELPVIPSTFFCVGVNYRDHVDRMAAKRGTKPSYPPRPDIGYRANNALIAHEENIVKPRDAGDQFQYEGELVAVVGKRAKHLTEENALSCILGYTLGNDLSERSWQAVDRTLWRAKNCDTWKPMGPFIATGLDPMNLEVAVKVNGKEVSRYSTSKMLFSCQHYIAQITKYMALLPGDVIWLGTDNATLPDLQHGDVCEIVQKDIGVLRNPVVRTGN